MKTIKSISLILFSSFLFLGVCGFSISEHFCLVPDDNCHEEQVVEEHEDSCCEIPDKSHQTDNDCCEDEVKHYQTSLQHFHDVLVKVPFVVSLNGDFNFFQTSIPLVEKKTGINNFSNPPPLLPNTYRSLIQVYII